MCAGDKICTIADGSGKPSVRLQFAQDADAATSQLMLDLACLYVAVRLTCTYPHTPCSALVSVLPCQNKAKVVSRFPAPFSAEVGQIQAGYMELLKTTFTGDLALKSDKLRKLVPCCSTCPSSTNFDMHEKARRRTKQTEKCV